MRILLVGNAGALEGVDQRRRLRVGAIEHGEIRKREVLFGGARRAPAVERKKAHAADHALDRLHDGGGFCALARRGLDGDALVHVAHHVGERFLLARVDHLRRGGDDGAAGAIVAGEPHDLGVWMIALEPVEARRIGAAKAVDRLVGVADDADVAAGRRQQREQPILLLVDVLEFVDRDRGEARPPECREAGIVGQGVHRQRNEIVEVDPIAHRECLLVGRQCLCGLCVEWTERALGLGNDAQEPAGLGRADRRNFGEERAALGFAGDAKAAMEAGGLGPLAQERQTEGVEGVDRHLPGAVRRQQAREPFAHLGRRAAGEGDRESTCRGDAEIGDQMRDAMGQRAGLARAGTGDDQQRPLDHLGGGALIVIERGENWRHDGASLDLPLKGGGRRPPT